jgi:hypothetical protein
VLGKQVENFLSGDVGKYLLDRANDEVKAGLAILKKVNYTDAEGVRLAQNRVWRGESVRDWLQQALIAGARAEAVLESREDEQQQVY